MKKEVKIIGGLFLLFSFLNALMGDGISGILHVWVTFCLWEVWYAILMESVKKKAPEYYANVSRRFLMSFVLILIIETVFSVMSAVTLYNSDMLSATAMGITCTVRFLAHSVLFIWQISMLMNAIAATMPLEQYTKERSKILLLLIFAPIGAFILPKE